MAAPSHRLSTIGKVMRELGNIGMSRSLAPWAAFVLALAVGRVLTGESAIDTGELCLGIPPSWLVAWLAAREMELASMAGGALIVGMGLAVGLLG
jgi:hypothetical protein